MTRSIRCQDCGTAFKLKTGSTAQRVKCPNCGESIVIGDRPATAAKTVKTKSSGTVEPSFSSNTIIILGVTAGLVGLISVLGVAGVAIWWRSASVTTPTSISQSPPNIAVPAPQGPVVDLNAPPLGNVPVPPPAGELEALEEMTVAKLRELMSTRPKRREGVVNSSNGGDTFSESEIYEDPADPTGLIISTWESKTLRIVAPKTIKDPQTGLEKTIVAEMGATRTGMNFLQKQPRYGGAMMDNGAPIGHWLRYHDNGKLRARGMYLDGQRNGDFVFLDANGKLLWEGTYLADQLVLGRLVSPADDVQADLATFYHDAAVIAVAWSPDGRYVAAETYGGRIHVWDVTQQEKVAEWRPATVPKADAPSALCFSGTGNMLVMAQQEDLRKRTLRFWKFLEPADPLLIDNSTAEGWKLNQPVSLDLLDDGRTLLIGSDPPALWDLENHRLIGLFDGARSPYFLVNQRQTLVAVDTDTMRNPLHELSRLVSFDVASRQNLQAFDVLGADDSVWRQGGYNFSGVYDLRPHIQSPRMTFRLNQISFTESKLAYRTIDVTTGEELPVIIPESPIVDFKAIDWFLLPTESLAYGIEENSSFNGFVKVHFLDLMTQKVKQEVQVSNLLHAMFTEDGQWLIGIGRGPRRFLNEATRRPDTMHIDNAVQIISTNDGKVYTIQNGNHDVTKVAKLSYDNRNIAVGSQDGSLVIWRLPGSVPAQE